MKEHVRMRGLESFATLVQPSVSGTPLAFCFFPRWFRLHGWKNSLVREGHASWKNAPVREGDGQTQPGGMPQQGYGAPPQPQQAP